MSETSKLNRVLRYESLFGVMTSILDASANIKTFVISSHKDLHFFNLEDAVSKNSVFLGFGKPNVYLGMPDGDKVVKFDAKSLKRAPSRIIDTRGIAQSGILFELNDLSSEIQEDIRLAAQSEVGTKQWTCVNANARVLQSAGFHLSDPMKRLDSFYFPMDLAKELLTNGLYCRGTRVNITVIRTVPSYMERFGWSVIKSQWLTLFRHTERFVNKKSVRAGKAIEKSKALFRAITLRAKKHLEPIEEDVVLFPEEKLSLVAKHNLEVTYPSRFGLWFRYLWGPHSFFTVSPEQNPIDSYLIDQLTPYVRKEKSTVNWIKQNILFCPSVVLFVRKHLLKNKTNPSEASEAELFNMLRTHTDNMPHKYNIVATGKQLIIMKLAIKYKTVDWILSKHILSSGYQEDVRFAGEIWKGLDGNIYVNNDSGTFSPSDEALSNFVAYLQEIFPNIPVKKVERIQK